MLNLGHKCGFGHVDLCVVCLPFGHTRSFTCSGESEPKQFLGGGVGRAVLGAVGVPGAVRVPGAVGIPRAMGVPRAECPLGRGGPQGCGHPQGHGGSRG